MDMDFKGAKKTAPKSAPKVAKNLPGFRASSELPTQSMDEVPTNISEDELAAAFVGDETSDDPTDLTLDREKNMTGSDREFVVPKKTRTKKKHVVILLIVLGIVIAGAAGWIVSQKMLDKQEQSGEVQTSEAEVKKEEKPTTVASPLTGRELAPELATRSVTAVMIENSVAARPQSGLLEADMIYEAVAEGGITRLVALYLESQPAAIGPIRSARPYYVDIARSFDAAYVHAGGSDDALARIKELGVKDMSAFETNGTYQRVNFRDAPHDLYSSMQKLDTRKSALGFNTSTFTPWQHKNDTPQTPTASSISFSLSGALYNPTFTYDATTNSYLRSQAGAAHTDNETGKQLNPKIVIGLVTSKGQNGIYSTYRLTGSGDIKVFQDGILSEGTWSKDSATSQFIFKDKNGLSFNFNKGQVWVTLLGSASDITFTP